jgi:hypothetical protein
LSELKAVVLNDLRYLATTWTVKEIDDNFLRRDSVTLRRLLIDDGGGLLRKARKEMGLRGDPRLSAIDLIEEIEGLDPRLIVLASAGGATHRGMAVAGALLYEGAMSPEQIKRQAARGMQVRDLPLSRYLDSPCLLTRGVRIPRRELIRYIANKKGGGHYDEKRDRKGDPRSFGALDSLIGAAQLAGKDAVYFELLSIGQALIKSPQIATMLA